MAAKKEEFNEKKLLKELSNFTFKRPERSEDGSLITPKYKTGIFYLDSLLNGGLPMGKIIGVGSEEGGGKTTLLIQAMGNIVETYPGKTGYYFDVEGGATYELWDAMGYADLLWDPEFNPKGPIKLISVETIQDIAKLIKMVTMDENTAMIVIDSDTQVADQADIDDELLGTGKNPAAKNARMWSGVMRPINAVIKRSNACLVIVHQARVDLSNFHAVMKASGGKSAKHVVSAEIWGVKKLYIGEGGVTEIAGSRVKKEEAIGVMLELRTEKNRLGLPFRKYIMPVYFGRGVSNLPAYQEWLLNNTYADPETGEVKDCIEWKKGGSWFQLNLPFLTDKIQGSQKLTKLLTDNIDTVREFVERESGLFN